MASSLKNLEDLSLASNEDIGTYVMSAAMILCEADDGTNDIAIGVERAGSAIAKVANESFNGPLAFNLKLLGQSGNVLTYCVTAHQNEFEQNETEFSAVIDGRRVNTNDEQELIEQLENCDKVTEFTISYNSDKKKLQ